VGVLEKSINPLNGNAAPFLLQCHSHPSCEGKGPSTANITNPRPTSHTSHTWLGPSSRRAVIQRPPQPCARHARGRRLSGQPCDIDIAASIRSRQLCIICTPRAAGRRRCRGKHQGEEPLFETLLQSGEWTGDIRENASDAPKHGTCMGAGSPSKTSPVFHPSIGVCSQRQARLASLEQAGAVSHPQSARLHIYLSLAMPPGEARRLRVTGPVRTESTDM